MNDKYTKEEIQAIAERAMRYINSMKGQCSIAAAMERARKVTDKLAEMRKIDQKKLNDPMRI